MVKIRIVNTNTDVHYETNCNDLYKYFTECHRLLGIKNLNEINKLCNVFEQQGHVSFTYRLYGYDMCISCMRFKY